jgi:hypothetical protein
MTAIAEAALMDGELGRRDKAAGIWARDAHDFYCEPAWTSKRLFEEEEFVGSITDPACGLGMASGQDHGQRRVPPHRQRRRQHAVLKREGALEAPSRPGRPTRCLGGFPTRCAAGNGAPSLADRRAGPLGAALALIDA